MRLRTLSLVAAGIVLLPAGPAAASATSATSTASPSATGTYQCRVSGTGSTTITTTVELTSVPDQVRPGQRLALPGTVTLGLPSTESLKTSLLLARQVGIGALDLRVVASAGGSPTAVKLAAVRGTKAPPGTPFTVAATVRLAPFTVPPGAHEVDLELPTAGAVADPLTGLAASGVPEKVAFTARLDEDGLVASRTVACWVADGTAKAPPIARITVGGPATSAPSNAAGAGGVSAGSAGAAPGRSVGTAGAALPALPGPAAPAASSEAGSADGLGPASAAAPPAAGDAPSPVDGQVADGAPESEPVYAAVPPATRAAGVRLPGWLLALAGLLVPLAAAFYAVTMHRRLALVRRRIAAERSR